MEIWGEIPPPFISLSIIARAHGAKFGERQPGARAAIPPPGSAGSDSANPEALMGFLGQAEPIPYRAPARGLPILH